MNAPALHLTGTVVIDDDTEVSDVWVYGGRFSFTPVSVPTVTLRGWFFPGLVDVHCHVGLDAQGAVTKEVARSQAIADRDSGVLLIRDAGSPADTSWVGQDLSLPHLIRCGHHLARPKRYIRNYAQELADPDQLTDALVENLTTRSDGWNKIVADWIDRDAGDLAPLWTPEQLTLGLDAVHARGGRVTAHTFSREAIGPLLDAKIDCIEHGTGMLFDDMVRAALQQVAVTPTLLQIGQFENIAAQGDSKFPAFSARLRQMYRNRYDQAHAFYEAGLHILVGTDAGGTLGHGRIADECAELVRAGIPAREVVAFASWRARRFLNVAGIEEGASGDVVGYSSDPRKDIRVLAHPGHVILRGVPVTS